MGDSRRQPTVELVDEGDLNSEFLPFTPHTFELRFEDGREVIDLLRLLVGLPPHTSQKPSARALRVLRPVPVGDIPEGEHQCNVCYEEFEEVPQEAFEGYLAAKAATESGGTPPALETEWYAKEEKDADHFALEMPCGHKFGRGCLVTWLDTSPTCPLCRQKLETEFEAQHSASNSEQPNRDALFQEYERLRPPHIWLRSQEVPAQDPAERVEADSEQDGDAANDPMQPFRMDSPRPMVVQFYPAGLPAGEFDRPSPHALRRFQRMVMRRAAREAFGQAAPGTAMRPPRAESPVPMSSEASSTSERSQTPFYGPERPPTGPASLASSTSPPPQGSRSNAPPGPLEPPVAPPADHTPSPWRFSPWIDRGLMGFYTIYQHVMPASSPASAEAGEQPDEASESSSRRESAMSDSAPTDSEPATPQSDSSSRRGPQRHGIPRNHPYR